MVKRKNTVEQLTPLTNLTTIDTLKLSRGNFNFNSHRLKYLAKLFGITNKLAHDGFQMWIDVVWHGKRKAMKEMVEYCEIDVIVVREYFYKILPYIDRLPAKLNAFISGVGKEKCPECGSRHTIKFGFRYMKGNVQQRHKCNSCGEDWIGS